MRASLRIRLEQLDSSGVILTNLEVYSIGAFDYGLNKSSFKIRVLQRLFGFRLTGKADRWSTKSVWVCMPCDRVLFSPVLNL